MRFPHRRASRWRCSISRGCGGLRNRASAGPAVISIRAERMERVPMSGFESRQAGSPVTRPEAARPGTRRGRARARWPSSSPPPSRRGRSSGPAEGSCGIGGDPGVGTRGRRARPLGELEAPADVYVKAYSAPGAMHAGLEYYRSVFQDVDELAELAQHRLSMPVLAMGGEQAVLGNRSGIRDARGGRQRPGRRHPAERTLGARGATRGALPAPAGLPVQPVRHCEPTGVGRPRVAQPGTGEARELHVVVAVGGPRRPSGCAVARRCWRPLAPAEPLTAAC